MSKLDVIWDMSGFRAEQWSGKFQEIHGRRIEAALSAAAATPHYKRIIERDKLPLDLQSFPLSDKEQIQGAPQDFINPAFRVSDLIKKRTSGSTFRPLDVYIDRRASEKFLSISMLGQIEAGRSLRDLLVSVWHGKRASIPIHERLGLFRKRLLSTFDDEEITYRRIRALRPDIVGSGSSVLHILAQLNSRSSDPLSLKRVFSGAELLSPSTQSLIEDSFNAPVFDFYACIEFGKVAKQCPEERNFHVNQSCHVEIMDSQGRPKKGGRGEIAITGLFNLAMPLIRYRIGDIGSLDKDCPCGRALPVLKNLEGRSMDMIVLPSGKMRSYLEMVTPLRVIRQIKQAQLIQEREGLFVLRYVPFERPITGEEADMAEARLRDYCKGEEISLEFEQVDEIKRGQTGKIRPFISKVKRPHEDCDIS